MNAMQKSRQFCSVCKDWLEMEVVPTGDGEDDDGVIWFRCPQCQGFLPKLSGGDSDSGDDSPGEAREEAVSVADTPPVAETVLADLDPVDGEDLIPDDAPADLPGKDGGGEKDKAPEASEPIAEYAAMLAAVDVDNPSPYRPWDSYEVGQCVTHLAWDDCGVVVAKEDLPGGRRIIKVFFSEAGVVRLIEQAPK